jgi:hypothetical protein
MSLRVLGLACTHSFTIFTELISAGHGRGSQCLLFKLLITRLSHDLYDQGHRFRGFEETQNDKNSQESREYACSYKGGK